MNISKSHYFNLLLLALVVLLGCEREPGGQPIVPQADNLARIQSACSAFQYADTLFYFREQAGEYLELPVREQQGTYGSSPYGLSLNASTGAINVNRSESGMKYRVWFVKQGSRDTCSRFITISGINYASGVYPLNAGLIQPFYNARRTASLPCSDSEDNSCEFDTPIPGLPAGLQGIAIGRRNGAIDLRKTLLNGVFGTVPVNGRVRTVRLYYRLNDASRKALNYIDLRVHWYSSVSQVPAALLAQINYKNSVTLRLATVPGLKPPTAPLLEEQSRPRPPDIVLVGN